MTDSLQTCNRDTIRPGTASVSFLRIGRFAPIIARLRDPKDASEAPIRGVDPMTVIRQMPASMPKVSTETLCGNFAEKWFPDHYFSALFGRIQPGPGIRLMKVFESLPLATCGWMMRLVRSRWTQRILAFQLTDLNLSSCRAISRILTLCRLAG
jgi:hypothetical protein